MILYENDFYNLLIKNNINCIATNYYTQSLVVQKFGRWCDVTTTTIDFKRTPSAHLFGVGLFILSDLNIEEFKVGILKNNKPSWSSHLSCNITYNEFNKFLKLKSFW